MTEDKPREQDVSAAVFIREHFMHYKLDENKNVVPCDLAEKSEWIKSLPEDQQTGIGCRVDWFGNDTVTVSTVFLGMDHLGGTFETMIFCDGERNEECHRYHTWDEAKAGHDRIVKEFVCRGDS